MNDQRYNLIYNRLSTLTETQLNRILEKIDMICFDTYNYDEENKKYCPLAIAFKLDETIADPTDQKIKNELARYFSPVNILKGKTGTFYTTNRKEDLIKICNDLLYS